MFFEVDFLEVIYN